MNGGFHDLLIGLFFYVNYNCSIEQKIIEDGPNSNKEKSRVQDGFRLLRIFFDERKIDQDSYKN